MQTVVIPPPKPEREQGRCQPGGLCLPNGTQLKIGSSTQIGRFKVYVLLEIASKPTVPIQPALPDHQQAAAAPTGINCPFLYKLAPFKATASATGSNPNLKTNLKKGSRGKKGRTLSAQKSLKNQRAILEYFSRSADGPMGRKDSGNDRM